MPLYEYQCESCGKKLEIIQKFSDPPRTRCPECKGRLRKLPSAPAIHFKGSGWYVNDYGKKDGGDKASGPADADRAGKNPEETKSTAEAPGDSKKKKKSGSK